MTLEDLEKRMARLELLEETRSEREDMETKNHLRDLAKLDALESVLEQIAFRLGVSQSEYCSHFLAQYNRHLGKYLDAASQISEPLSAPLDGRQLDEIDVGDAIPPLFPDQ